jgi:hypothetical protein
LKGKVATGDFRKKFFNLYDNKMMFERTTSNCKHENITIGIPSRESIDKEHPNFVPFVGDNSKRIAE